MNIGPRIEPVREFLTPGLEQPWGDRTENSPEVRERYPDLQDAPNRVPQFPLDGQFFVVRRAEVIPGVFAPTTPKLVTGAQINSSGAAFSHQARIAQLEFLPVYYQAVA